MEESQKITIFKGFKIINLSDLFFEQKMRDGYPYEQNRYIKFNHTSDEKKIYTNLECDYDRVLKDQREAKH
jgi:hypothetical protein